MMIEILYLLVSVAACSMLIYRDVAKKPLFFAILFFVGVVGSIPFEYPLISMGLWSHLVYPQVLGVSWFASLMYAPFLGICYIIGKSMTKRFKRNEYAMYLLCGMVVGFVIDITSVALGFYKYNFSFPIAIGGVPLGITIAEGVGVAIAILFSNWFYGVLTSSQHKR